MVSEQNDGFNWKDRKLRKTSQELCKRCMYHISMSAGMNYMACNYIVKTSKRRNCPIGWCDKYKKGRVAEDE